jgi:Ser/Thr protein kinase RdoA (MazF antagonist)
MQSDSTQAQIQQLLTTTPPALSAADAVEIVSRNFNIEGSLKLLVSERDQNFRVETASGQRYTLKISNHAEQLPAIDFQNRALLHAAGHDPSLPLPRVIPSRNGELYCCVEANDKKHFVRVYSWLEGLVLGDIKPSAGLTCKLGRLMARLGLALEGFEHPGSNPPSLWDMKRAASLQELLQYMGDPKLRQLIGRVLDRFVTAVKPELDLLRVQVIHNDINMGNVLVDKNKPTEITGIIDFGDLTRSPLIIDLAVAASYQLNEGDDPLAGTLPLIAGYHAIRPLQDEELSLLPDLIRTRLITSLLINNYRVKLFPENREYLMTSYDSARQFLIHLDGLDNDDAYNRIRTYLRADQES